MGKGMNRENEERFRSFYINEVMRIEKQMNMDVNIARCNFSFFAHSWVEQEIIISTLKSQVRFSPNVILQKNSLCK